MVRNAGKTLSFKVSLFFAIVSAVLVAVLSAITLISFRHFSVSTATEHLRTAAEIVRVHLTEAMITGVIDQRQSFLLRLSEVQNLKTARVVRSPLIDEQFGKVRKGEYTPDKIEEQVLQTGEPVFDLYENNGELIFRGTIPYIASNEGSPNCLQCHAVSQGAILGAVTMTMSITALRHATLLTVITIVAVVMGLVLVLGIILYYLLRPISNTAAAVEQVTQDAIGGDFKGHVEKQTNDEIGQIADDMNRLLEFLNTELNRIGDQVAQLTSKKPEPGENLLLATVDMVEQLTQISHYKLAIEEDDAKIDVYKRLISTLRHKFLDPHTEYSFYEIPTDKSELRPILVNDSLGGPCRWCDEKILTTPTSCRVFHTGHMVDGIIQPDICYHFLNSADGETRYPLCFPILQSGTVGSVMQLVIKEDCKARAQAALPYIHAYLRDTAPVLEVRRLMETLRESSLRDPMTGLHNRRFLEECVEALVANVYRKQHPISILMLDLDHFKMVNDTYGHDAGDTVLKALANVIKQSVRASDIVIRFGGEEFLIVLQETSGAASTQIAEKIRAAVEVMQIQFSGVVLQKTISIGIADFPADSNTFWQAVKFADVALYRAKESGRNRVVSFSKDMWADNNEY
ncbi:GGDEF domain-containing protein [Betaproteobacteria bacterium]|nr:GGDEF domain-containing protein [Betaproteobacteria bacterium]GHU28645.1 GGDEF domain-containing protein [Betaproteobacteria bacterium]